MAWILPGDGLLSPAHLEQLGQPPAPQQLPLAPQAISAQPISVSCTESPCSIRVTRRVWFRF